MNNQPSTQTNSPQTTIAPEKMISHPATDASPIPRIATLASATTAENGEQLKLDESGLVAPPTAASTGPDNSIRALISAARKDPSKVVPLLSTKKEVVEVPVYKMPPKHLFWRVRVDAEPICFDLLHLRPEGTADAFYLIEKNLSQPLKDNVYYTKFVHSYRLLLVIDPKGAYGWWPLRCESDNAWHESAREIAKRLENTWGRVQGSKQKYDFLPADDDLGEPEWPIEEDLELLEKAFKKQFITSMDHPVLNELRGKAQ